MDACRPVLECGQGVDREGDAPVDDQAIGPAEVGRAQGDSVGDALVSVYELHAVLDGSAREQTHGVEVCLVS